MEMNYRYMLDFARRTLAAQPDACVLDYGCGGGDVVAEGRRQGMAFFGAEVFYGGSRARQLVQEKGLLGDVVREIRDGKLLFEDHSFGLVLSNQVFEHVEDLEGVLEEIWRVLQPGGLLLALYPTREVLREGHMGIPFAHWFGRTSRLRYGYVLALRRLGLGSHKGEKSAPAWARHKLDWLDRYTVYRRSDEIDCLLRRRFELRGVEDEYAAYRLESRPGPVGQVARALVRAAPLRPAAGWLVRRLGGRVIVARKKVD